MKVTGACHCGAITIEGEADPEKVGTCHCTDCQTGTGSAFRVSVPIDGGVFRMKGKPTNYIKTTAASGRPRVQAFCGACGLSIYSTTPVDGQQATNKEHNENQTQHDQLMPKKQNWFRSARSW